MSTKRDAGTPESETQRIGPTLKRLRESAGLSLRTLADQIGFSASFLSQAEHGVVSPSIGSLEKIAAALGTTLADLFFVPPTTDGAVIRAHARPNVQSAWSKARIEALTPAGGPRTLEAVMIRLEGGGSSEQYAAISQVDQFAIVWDGAFVLTHADEEIELNAGDSVLIRAKTSHRWRNPGRSAAHILIVSSPVREGQQG
ncbi:MAG: XRE family transcriptional regulator [Acidobacteriota bacterium]